MTTSRMPHSRWRWSGWSVGLALFAWFACSAWIRPLVRPDEGRYVGVAWEMLRDHNWMVPTLDGMPFFHKPVLFYWLSAAAMKLLGANVWAARMPSILGAAAAAWGLYLFARRWGDERQARWSALVLATMPFFALGAQFANLDMLVAGCISVTILLGAHAVLLAEEGAPYRTPLYAAYAAAGLGLLAKGLIGGVLPVGTFIVWLLATRRPRHLLTLASPVGLIVFLLVGMPWFVAMQLRYPGFFDYFVIYHHFKRFAASGFNNVQPFWFYPAAILLLSLPASLAIFGWLGRARPVEAPKRQPSVTWLMWAWFAVVVVFFSLPKSKLVGYVLPAVPPFAWLVAGVVQSRPRAGMAAAAVGAVLSVGVAIGLGLKYPHSMKGIGQALAAQRQPGEPVVFIDRYAYDLPFYARLETSPQVLYDWKRADIVQHDDWHKELYDAGLFDPAAARRTLIDRSTLAALRCAPRTVWVLATPDQVKADALLQGAQPVATHPDATLWRLPPSGVKCVEMPSAGSAGR
jgi:4-amino-4-deoxy-L-arabinose transferase-like glycosyltransferase